MERELSFYIDKPKQVVAYEPKFDRQAYSEVTDKERLDAYTKKQLETHLGERFNVLLSQTRFEIRNKEIYGENTQEPFMGVLQRGVKYRRENGNPVDFEREEAEVTGFSKIQTKLADEKTKTGAMMLSISPPGKEDSIYKHNFYDVFTLKQDEKGKYIEGIRYSSSLTTEEYIEKLKPIKDFQNKPEDVDFLKDPIAIDATLFEDSDSIHKYFHKEHEYITKAEFDKIIEITTPLITSYINTLSDKPFDENLQLLTYNAILNKADIALTATKSNDQDIMKNYSLQSNFALKAEIFSLGRQPVRVVASGCGSSGGFAVRNMVNASSLPFSVSEFAMKKGEEKEWFSCPKCSYKATGPIGDTCPGCRLTKEEYVEKGGTAC